MIKYFLVFYDPDTWEIEKIMKWRDWTTIPYEDRPPYKKVQGITARDELDAYKIARFDILHQKRLTAEAKARKAKEREKHAGAYRRKHDSAKQRREKRDEALGGRLRW